MSTRQVIVDAITPILPDDWTVVPYTEEPNVLDDVLVMVGMSGIAPGVVAGTYSLEHHVYVLIPQQGDAEGNTDAVDDAVLLVLNAILRMRAVAQGSAERATFQGGHPCWDITITIQASVTDEEEG